MIKPQIDSDTPKDKALVVLEHVIFGLCVCVIVLRTTFTEGPMVQTGGPLSGLTDSMFELPIWRAVLISSFSIAVSTALIFSFVFWVVLSFCTRKFVYRLSGLEIGLLLFCIAAVISGVSAPDKRAAIDSFSGLIAPVFMAILLVQILDSKTKIHLSLILIVALGVVSTYRCWEQYSENEHLITFYEEDPAATLAQHRIEPNSLEHFQFEHRLYSKDISGFFTTSNSAGSFALMASFAAGVLIIEHLRKRKFDSLGIAWLIMRCIAAGLVVLGLVITKSKGAIIGSVFAAAIFTVYLCFGRWLRAYKKTIFIICLLLGIACGWAAVAYGLAHGRLPGGNSMLVRWQYWQASLKMYADHLLTGVGPGNFAHFYTHYKPASASESVADPHNFLLSILSQYGPIGLTGFLAMIFVPLWMVSSGKSANHSPDVKETGPDFKKSATVLLIGVSVSLLLIRPIVFPLPPTATAQERHAGVIILYVMPVFVFAAGFLLAAAGASAERPHSCISMAALFCAVLGVLVHNLIDFAIFEPGVLTVFWAMIACLAAMHCRRHPRGQAVSDIGRSVTVPAIMTGVLFILVYANYALIPAIRASGKIHSANRAIFSGRFEQAHRLLESASQEDPLSPAAQSLDGRLYLHEFKLTSGVNRELLLEAEERLLAAIARNRAAFKNYERLTEVYTLLADISKGPEKIDWLNKAFDNTLFTVENLYPGCARLYVELAKTSELLGKTDFAISQYERAIEIEDEYRAQFRKMYPDRQETVSRLGSKKYKFAKRRMEHLAEQLTPE
jgi:hypothetical protein